VILLRERVALREGYHATTAKWQVAGPENSTNGAGRNGGFIIEKPHEFQIPKWVGTANAIGWRVGSFSPAV